MDDQNSENSDFTDRLDRLTSYDLFHDWQFYGYLHARLGNLLTCLNNEILGLYQKSVQRRMNNADSSRESLLILRDTSECATAVPVYDLFWNLSSFDCTVTTILRPPLTPSVSRSLVLCSASWKGKNKTNRTFIVQTEKYSIKRDHFLLIQ